jgi:GNAT superfamily N-acetyltransferase
LLTVEPLAEHRVASLHALFEAASCPCFCRFWHFSGTKNEWLDRCAHRREENFAELERGVHIGDPSARGLVAIAERTFGSLPEGTVIGWMKLTARKSVPKLRALPVYRSLDLGDEATTFSIGCLLVHPEARGRGVARALVGAAPDMARAWGAHAVEAYPRRSAEPLHPEEAWQGPECVFVDAGFEAVHDIGPYPVYRRILRPIGRGG